jgi:AcrR family transcriptional regulator
MAAGTRRARLTVDERRRQLLLVGREVFSSHPYEAVAVEDIAERAGVSVGLLYHYFGGKRDYFLAVVRTAADDLLAATRPDPGTPPEQQLRAGLTAHLAYADQHAEGWSKLMGGGGVDDDLRAIVAETREEVVQRYTAAISSRPTPVLLAALHGWIGFVDALTVRWLAAGEPDREALVDLMEATFVAMLGAVHRTDPDLVLDGGG